MAKYEEIVAEVEVPLDKVKLSVPSDPGLPLFTASPPAVMPDDHCTVKLVLTGLMDTEEVETYEQALERERAEGAASTITATGLVPKERYALRGSLQVTSLRLDVIG